MLADGLFDAMLSEFTRLDELPDVRGRDTFLRLAVEVLSYSGIDSSSRGRLLSEVVLVLEGAYAADFAQVVTRFLRLRDRKSVV